MRFVTANLDKNRGGDKKYLAYLTSRYRPCVLGLQEKGHGIRSTRVRGVGVKVTKQTWRVLGRIGVHRGIARRTVRIGGKKVIVFSIHGLHVRTVGKINQNAYYSVLERIISRLNRKNKLWVVIGDFNASPTAIAERLSGTSIRHGVDGIIVSKGLKVGGKEVDFYGKQKNYTDHPALVGNVTLAKN